MKEDLNELLDAGEAVRYLAKKWGIDSYSVDAFKMLRRRWNIEPALKARGARATFYRKADLDLIPKPNRGKPRGPRSKNAETVARDFAVA